jgi:hypothetical protein
MKYRKLFSPPVLMGLLVLVIFTGCASSDAGMEAFVGQPSSELLARFGPPRLRIPEGQGGQIWTYIEDSPAAMQSGPMNMGSLQSYGGGSTARTAAFTSTGFTSRKEFFIDASGTIYKYRGRAD